MKKSILTMLCSLMILQFTAQQKTEVTFKNTNWLKFDPLAPLTAKALTTKLSAKQLGQNKDILNLQPADNLSFIKTTTDLFGIKHFSYQHMHKGIPVEGGVYKIHEKNGIVKLANGQLIEQLNLNTQAAISESDALLIALQHINATLYAWNDPAHESMLQLVEQDTTQTFYPCADLVIVDPSFKQKAANCRLAYKFDIYALEPLTRQLVYVDAQNGNILSTVEQIKNGDVPASGTSNYAGIINFTAYTGGNKNILKSSSPVTMQVFTANNTRAYPQIPIISNSNFFDSDPTANEVHGATQLTYNYFKNTFGRNSIDNNNMPLYSWVHYGVNFNNAFWNGNWMTYGDGDNITFSSLTSVDVVAHEMMHGITQYEANLMYQGESGALNESFSDIFGEVVEALSTGGNDWIVGADFTVRAGKNGLRSLSNPNDPTMLTQQPDTYQGDFWYEINPPCQSFNDYCGVHYNSGVQNYWFYLLSEGGTVVNDNNEYYVVEPIGMNKAAEIAYRNLTVYLTPNSNYADAREGSIQAAKDLYGENSTEVIQTQTAWCAVGVGNDCTDSDVTCDPLKDKAALIALYNSTNGANWTNTWDLNQPMDTWFKVGLTSEGCVRSLLLYDNNLVGTIPNEIGDLSNLEDLRLHSNPLLGGTIPSTIGQLSSLVNLSLSDNSFSGSIPNEIGNLISLQNMSIKNNQLTGSIPSEIGKLLNLINLRLQDNSLEGPIPSEIGDLINLEEMELYNNELSGSIPDEIGKLINLKSLELHYNNLTGSIPSTIGGLQNLEYLGVRNNQLTGSLPVGIYDLINLEALTLSVNELSGGLSSQIGNLVNLERLSIFSNNFTGLIPAELGDLDSLSYFNLGNQMGGCFHENLLNLCAGIVRIDSRNYDATWEDFCATQAGICDPCTRTADSLALVALYNSTNGSNWTNTWDLMQAMDTWYGIRLENGRVTGIDLDGYVNFDSPTPNTDGNNLIGSIPPEIGDLCELTYLDLGENEGLTGNIPPEIGELNSLEKLDFVRNEISGSIPPELGNCLNLTSLNIGGNNLTGTIPAELGNLYNLRSLSLYYNELTGEIPPELSNLSNLELMGLNNNQLSGNIPFEMGSLINLVRLALNNNLFSGEIPVDLCNLTNLDYLALSNNQLTGNIPPCFGNLVELGLFHINNNNLSGCYDSNLFKFLCIQLPQSDYFDENEDVSDGNNFDATWEDFCLNAAGSCDALNPIYPGDFNNDGTANILDLLYWALAEDEEGTVRPNASTNWVAQYGLDWFNQVNGVNGKFQDGDGNGIVNSTDLLSLVNNYGKRHTPVSAMFTGSPVIFRLEPLSSIPGENNTQIIEYHLYAESAFGLPFSTHGLTCSIYFGNLPISSVEVDFSESVLVPHETISKYHADINALDIGLTRKDKTNVSIGGVLAKIIAIAEDVDPTNPFLITIGGGNAMSGGGELSPVNGTGLFISLSSGSDANTDIPVSISTSDEQCDGTLGSAKVYALGNDTYTFNWSNGATGSEVNDLISGNYTVTITDSNNNSKTVSIKINGQVPIYDSIGNLLCGSVCPEFLNPTGAITNGSYSVNHTLISNAIVPKDNTVIYTAVERITLEPGTSIRGNFRATTEACD